MRPTRVAVIQMNATTDVDANVAATLELCDRARHEAGAECIHVPEAFAFIGPNRERDAMLEPLPAGGPILERCREAAARLGVDLVLGGFHERCDDDDTRAANTCVHIAPDGGVAATYRKIHLFDVELSDGTTLNESAKTRPGADIVTTEMPHGTLGLTVCYDVRFPELYRRLVDAGATSFTVPSAFTLTTGMDHWHVLLRARAIENQSYVFAPAQFGSHGARRSYGHGLIVDPWGTVIAECGPGPGYACATVDPAEVERVRRELPSLANRRLPA